MPSDMRRHRNRRATWKRSFEQKMAEYRHILKNDHDWDYDYILRLLQYKLERTRKCIVSNNIAPVAKQIDRQIRHVEVLLGCVIKDRYYDRISKGFHKKYGWPRIVELPRAKDAQVVPITIRYPKETPRNSEQIHRAAMRLYEKAENMKKRDLTDALTFIQKNIWGWWD